MPGIEPLREQYRPRLEQALATLQAAASTYGKLTDELATLFARELVIRDEHELALDRTIGLVRAAYPRDLAIQRVIFPPATRSGGEELDEEEDAEEPAAAER